MAISILARVIRNCNLIEIFTIDRKVMMSNAKIEEYMSRIMLKSEVKLRALGVQMITNLVLNNVSLPEMISHCVQVSHHEKTIVKVELSYLWATLVELISSETAMQLLEKGLYFVLRAYLEEDKQIIRENALKAFKVIIDKAHSWGSYGNRLLFKLSTDGIMDLVSNGRSVSKVKKGDMEEE